MTDEKTERTDFVTDPEAVLFSYGEFPSESKNPEGYRLLHDEEAENFLLQKRHSPSHKEILHSFSEIGVRRNPLDGVKRRHISEDIYWQTIEEWPFEKKDEVLGLARDLVAKDQEKLLAREVAEAKLQKRIAEAREAISDPLAKPQKPQPPQRRPGTPGNEVSATRGR